MVLVSAERLIYVFGGSCWMFEMRSGSSRNWVLFYGWD